ncbi:MAG: hypothetical protein LBI01_06405 [Elusimicrobium sp.]|jgi:hypothetical protein|nr:hypothetical protein [Elusimicrobium sp.]
MFKNEKVLITVLILAGILSFCYAKRMDNMKVRADAKLAIAAVKKHMLLADGVINFKKQYGIYPDEKIYKTWGNMDRSKIKEEHEARAREIFAAVYNEMDIFRSQNFTLTKNFGFSDGQWIYFTHTGLDRADITGLISKVQPGVDYVNNKVSFSQLDMLVEYRNVTPRHVQIQCLPLTEYQVKVCKKVLKYFRKQKSSDVIYFIPQEKVSVNDITFG